MTKSATTIIPPIVTIRTVVVVAMNGFTRLKNLTPPRLPPAPPKIFSDRRASLQEKTTLTIVPTLNRIGVRFTGGPDMKGRGFNNKGHYWKKNNDSPLRAYIDTPIVSLYMCTTLNFHWPIYSKGTSVYYRNRSFSKHLLYHTQYLTSQGSYREVNDLMHIHLWYTISLIFF